MQQYRRGQADYSLPNKEQCLIGHTEQKRRNTAAHCVALRLRRNRQVFVRVRRQFGHTRRSAGDSATCG